MHRLFKNLCIFTSIYLTSYRYGCQFYRLIVCLLRRLRPTFLPGTNEKSIRRSLGSKRRWFYDELSIAYLHFHGLLAAVACKNGCSFMVRISFDKPLLFPTSLFYLSTSNSKPGKFKTLCRKIDRGALVPYCITGSSLTKPVFFSVV